MCCGWTARTRVAESRRSTAPKRVGFLVLVGVGSDAQAWHWARVWLSGGLFRLNEAPTCRCAVLHLGCRGPLAAWPALWVGVQQLHLHRHRGPFDRVLQRRRGAYGALTHAYAAAGARRARHHEGSAPPPPSRRCSCTAIVRRSAGGCSALVHWRPGHG